MSIYIKQDYNLKYDFSALAEAVNFTPSNYLNCDESTPIQVYWTKYDMLSCGEIVGNRDYLFAGNLVATSTKTGRKSREVFTWKNKKSFIKVLNYLRSLDEPNFNKVKFEND